MSFTCPKCGRTSYHPEDARHGYCGACHEFTGASALQDARGKLQEAMEMLLDKLIEEELKAR